MHARKHMQPAAKISKNSIHATLDPTSSKLELKHTIIIDALADVSSRCKRNEKAKRAHSLYLILF